MYYEEIFLWITVEELRDYEELMLDSYHQVITVKVKDLYREIATIKLP
jgi:hypothetical protein